MKEHALFYVRHSVRPLQRERRRSVFAAFAVAVGVAAVVGLQTLSLSIGDSVTGDIQATHQGDVVVSNGDNPFPSEVRELMESVLAGSKATDWTWLLLAHPDRPSFVAAEGATESGSLQWFQPYLVDPKKYPLYGELSTTEPIEGLLDAPGNVLISRGLATRMGVGVGDRIMVENTRTFVVAALVSNQDSGGVFAPYFVPPMPWFAFFSIDDPTAHDVFGTKTDEAGVLFIKTRTDEDADAVAREIEAATWLAASGELDKPVGGNIFVHLPADEVGHRDRVAAQISSTPGVSNVAEFHSFFLPPGPDSPEWVPGRWLVGADPVDFSVETSRGRRLSPDDSGRPVAVAHGFPDQGAEGHDGRLGSEQSYTIGGQAVTLEIVGITAGDAPVPTVLTDSHILAPLASIDRSVPRTSISFLLTVPESEAPTAAARIARAVPGATAVFVDSPTAVVQAREIDLGDRAPVSVETAAERLPEVEDTTAVLSRVIMVTGLVSLAIGGIGILNTMLVVVGRRTQEIGVLKALGLKGSQVTVLFMIEGVVLGILGSIGGVLLGLALSVGLTRVGQQFLQTDVGWQFQLAPIYTGLIVGVVATTVFGFLPTLAASRVRPNVVLQPQSTSLPKTGRLVSIAVVLGLTAVMGLVATVFVDDPVIGLAGAYGALAGLVLLTVILVGVVWVIGKLPSFGSVNLKMSLRGLSRQKGRAASTLLALVIGIFAMASIVVLGGTLKDLADEIVEDAVGGNVVLIVPGADPLTVQRASGAVSSLDAPTNVVEDHQYAARIVAVNGNRDRKWGSTMVARRGVPVEGPPTVSAGRLLGPQDEGEPLVVVGSGVADDLELKVGDTLTFDIGARWFNGELVGGRETDLELVGITEEVWPATGGFSDDGGFIIPIGGLDSTFRSEDAVFVITADESDGPAIAEELTKAVPGAIAMESRTVAGVFKDILDRIAVFPMALSALALFAGAVIIANSVALATMERRREIATMKAVGAKGSRVLASLLLENGIIGLVGGLIGVGLATVVLVVINRFDSEIPVSPDPVSAVSVVAVALAVALVAAVISAWPASKEKPLNVLRYE